MQLHATVAQLTFCVLGTVMNSIKFLVISTLALILTACGGSGSSSSFSSLVRYSELQPDVSIRNTSAITQQVTYTVDGNNDVSNIGDVTAAGSATVTEEYQDGTVNDEPNADPADTTNDIHELSITSAEGTVISYDHSTDNLEESFFGVQVMDNETDSANNSDDATYAILYSNPYDHGLDYNSYGIWFKLSTETASGYTYDLGTVSSGVKTDAANMPTTGSASYSGSHISHYYGPIDGVNGGLASEYVVAGTVSMDVDFTGDRAISFATTVSNVEDDETSSELTGADLTSAQTTLATSGALSINGSSFTGSVTADGGFLVGSVTGQFYGPAAEEAGGVFELQDNGEAVTSTYIGAFGAGL